MDYHQLKRIWHAGREKAKRLLGPAEKPEEIQDNPYARPKDPAGSDIKTIEVLEKSECCGCSSCMNSCPVNAIEMKADEDGFLYPHVNHEICTACGQCQEHCPAIQVTYDHAPKPQCRAVTADDGTRQKSASGGVFTMLARNCFEKGGYVCGTAFDEDFTVRHLLIRSSKELYKLRNVKYVQSDTGAVYPRIREALEKNIPVLFCGCPCQTAGLYAYLKKDYEHLLTVDLVCRGVPSPETFSKYLKDTYGDKEIQDVVFRDKKHFGWNDSMCVYFKDGTFSLQKGAVDLYMRAYSASMGLRPSCGTCRYSGLSRQGDISLGDFGGIARSAPELNDGKGTSLVLLNSEKGKNAFEAIKGKARAEKEMPYEQALAANREIVQPPKPHGSSGRFLKLLKIYPFDKAFYYAAGDKYDVGVIGLWYGRNYGSMITYYALHKQLASMGLSVLMINNPLSAKGEEYTKTHPKRFAQNLYQISRVYPLGDLRKLNDRCDSFLVGSDQLWNYGLSRAYGQYYFLNFADDSKKKIAYGTSFGKQVYIAPDNYRDLAVQNMQRFDHVSVREDFAIDMCRDIFGVEATWVTDPVFFCRDTDYAEIESERPECRDEPYVLAYILDPTKEKTDALLHVAEHFHMRVKIILNEIPQKFEENKARLELPPQAPADVLKEVDIREWLYCFHHCSYVFTDSFHGTCFAIIFRKNFTSIANQGRGSLRFSSLLKWVGLEERLLQDESGVYEHPMMDDEIDYEKVFERIDGTVKFSADWLRNALFSPKTVKNYTTYPMLDSRLEK